MSKQSDRSQPGAAPAKRAEAKDDPHLKEFVANARRIQDEEAAAGMEQLRVQDQYDKRNAELRRKAQQTLREGGE